MFGQVVGKVKFKKYILVTYKLRLLGFEIELKRKLMRR